MPAPQRPGPRTRPDAFPSGARYVEALQNTDVCFTDPALRGAKVTMDRLGMPRPISGNFASVFALTDASGRRYAVKCFTQNVSDQHKRYNAISRRLAQLNPEELSQPWKMEFEYLDEGILVDGFRWPVLKMAWMDGIGLLRWLDQNYYRPDLVEYLADQFLQLVVDLEKAGVAHGDLQHGNLLVAPDNTLRLVDYDGMYVEALAGLPAGEEGHRHYQSPKRQAADFGPLMDRFSAWLIYLSLQVLAHDSGLWFRMHDPDGEFLLLEQGDFAEPGSSPRLSALATSSPLGRVAADQIKELTTSPLAALPELAPVSAVRLAQAAQEAALSASGTFAGRTGLSGTGLDSTFGARTVSAGPLPGGGTLPAWMSDHLLLTPAELPEVDVARFSGRSLLDFLGILLSLVSCGGAALLAQTGLIASPVAVLVGGVTVLWLHLGRRFRPEVRALHRYRREYARARRRGTELEGQLAALDKQAAEAEAGRNRQRAALTEQRNQLTTRRAVEISEVDRACAQQLAEVNKELAILDVRLAEQLQLQLSLYRQAYVSAQLSTCRIESAIQALPDLGRNAAARLSAAGIRTAADFIGIRVASSGRYSKTAYFVLRGGGEVRVSSMSEYRARLLEDWRKRMEARALLTAPPSLDPARVVALRQTQRERVDYWRGRATAAEAEARRRRESVNREVARTDTDISNQLNALTLTDSQAGRQLEAWRRPVEIALTQSRAVADAYWQGLRHARVLSFYWYLWFLLTGG